MSRIYETDRNHIADADVSAGVKCVDPATLFFAVSIIIIPGDRIAGGFRMVPQDFGYAGHGNLNSCIDTRCTYV